MNTRAKKKSKWQISRVCGLCGRVEQIGGLAAKMGTTYTDGELRNFVCSHCRKEHGGDRRRIGRALLRRTEGYCVLCSAAFPLAHGVRLFSHDLCEPCFSDSVKKYPAENLLSEIKDKSERRKPS